MENHGFTIQNHGKTMETHRKPRFLPWNIVGLYIHIPSNKAVHWFCLQHFAAGVEGARSFCSSLCSLKQILQRQSSWNKQKSRGVFLGLLRLVAAFDSPLGFVHGSCFLTAWQPLRQLWRSKHLQRISAAQPCRGQLVAVSWQQRAQPLAKKGVQFLAAPINMTKLPSLTRLLGYIPNYPTDFLPIMWVKQCHRHP